MNITNIGSTIKTRFGINKNSNNPKIDLISKDTVSFSGSASIKKKIADFKALKPEEYSSQDIDDAIKIMDYFGYKQTKNYPNLLYKGPYGQTITISINKKMPTSFIGDFVTALKRADEFNGELILLDHPMSEQEKEEWHHRLETREPNKNHENQYALDLEIQSKKTETPKDIDTSKEDKRIENEQRTILSCAMSFVQTEQNDLSNISFKFNELKNQIKQLKTTEFDEELSIIENEINEKQEQILAKNKKLNDYKIKLGNELLTEEELDDIEECEFNKIDFKETEAKISNLEDKVITKLIDNDNIKEELITKIGTVSYNILDIEDNIEKIKQEIDEYKMYSVLKEPLAKANEILTKVEKELEQVKKQINNYQRTDLNKASDKLIKTTIEKVENINNTQIKEFNVQINNIKAILESEIKPILTATDEEKARRQEAISRKFGEQTTHPIPTTEIETDITSDEVDEVETNTHIIEEVPETIETEQPTSVAQAPMLDNKPITFNEIKSNLASKLPILPLPNVEKAYIKMLDKYMQESNFSALKKDVDTITGYINRVVSQISKTNDFKRANNAIRFALLNEIYDSSSNKDGNIFAFSPTETTEVIDKIKNGEKDITIHSNGNDVKISLNKDVDFEKINSIFANYNENLQDLDAKKGEAIIKELTKYKQDISPQDEKNLFFQLGASGRYLELLTMETTPIELKKEVLQDFWKNFDKKNKTSYTEEIIQAFNKIQAEEDEETKTQQKLDDIMKQDWTIF